VIYAGWNVEILFLAAVGGLTVLKGLPPRGKGASGFASGFPLRSRLGPQRHQQR